MINILINNNDADLLVRMFIDSMPLLMKDQLKLHKLLLSGGYSIGGKNKIKQELILVDKKIQLIISIFDQLQVIKPTP